MRESVEKNTKRDQIKVQFERILNLSLFDYKKIPKNKFELDL